MSSNKSNKHREIFYVNVRTTERRKIKTILRNVIKILKKQKNVSLFLREKTEFKKCNSVFCEKEENSAI